MKNLEKLLKHHPFSYINSRDLEILLGNATPDSRYGKVKRLIAEKKLIPLRKGLYVISEEMGITKKPHPFELAEQIYGPSYISFESALSYHGLIPEMVYTTTSACTSRSKEFNTSMGKFVYLHLPLENFFLDVEIIKENSYQFFMAKPWKAICDYIYYYKKNWTSLEPLISSLRINMENLPELTHEKAYLLDEFYHNERLHKFLKKIPKGKKDEC